MSRLQSIRLAQFWKFRLAPLLNPAARHPLRESELFEAVGWLSQGVFCRYFDAVDADVLWLRIRAVMPPFNLPHGKMPKGQIEGVQQLLRSNQPFRDLDQMTEGPQRSFESPLFASALLLADRWASDVLTRCATAWIWSEEEESQVAERVMPQPVAPDDVVERLSNETPTPNDGDPDGADPPSIVAGYLRMLEHMQASAEFFKYAKSFVSQGVDFDSYCERVGGLNAWRVPLDDGLRAARLRRLNMQAIATVESAIGPDQVDGFEEAFARHVAQIDDAWKASHFVALLAPLGA